MTSRAVAEGGSVRSEGVFNSGSSSTSWTLNGHGVATSNQKPIVVQTRPMSYTRFTSIYKYRATATVLTCCFRIISFCFTNTYQSVNTTLRTNRISTLRIRLKAELAACRRNFRDDRLTAPCDDSAQTEWTAKRRTTF